LSDTCFVIQPFDHGPFDKLFEDVFVPAVEAAGLEPYRVDRDPSSTIPIQDIERGISSAQICLAEVSTDNPNVWFELGFAIALNKPLCIVCRATRTRYPFDIQHRSIVNYEVDSPRDFIALKDKITKRLGALLAKRNTISIETYSKPQAGLLEHEIACLAALVAESNGLRGKLSNYYLKKEMSSLGFNSLAAQTALGKLVRFGYVDANGRYDQDGDWFEQYSITDSGWEWVSENIHNFQLKAPPQVIAEDDIPF
jgi:nucleoside 2-deoxyribosyltransferase